MKATRIQYMYNEVTCFHFLLQQFKKNVNKVDCHLLEVFKKLQTELNDFLINPTLIELDGDIRLNIDYEQFKILRLLRCSTCNLDLRVECMYDHYNGKAHKKAVVAKAKAKQELKETQIKDSVQPVVCETNIDNAKVINEANQWDGADNSNVKQEHSIQNQPITSPQTNITPNVTTQNSPPKNKDPLKHLERQNKNAEQMKQKEQNRPKRQAPVEWIKRNMTGKKHNSDLREIRRLRESLTKFVEKAKQKEANDNNGYSGNSSRYQSRLQESYSDRTRYDFPANAMSQNMFNNYSGNNGRGGFNERSLDFRNNDRGNFGGNY